MKCAPRKRNILAAALVCAASFGTTRVLGGEEDDLARQIDIHRADAKDMEQLDKWRAAVADLTLLRQWLDDAWDLRSRHQYNAVRELLDRVDLQANLIREEIKLRNLAAEIETRETLLRENRLKIERTRRALAMTTAQIKVASSDLEGHPRSRANNPDGGPMDGNADANLSN